MKKLLFTALLMFAAVDAARAQAGNPPYTVEQSVIASGGGTSQSAGSYKIEGTAGQAAAGTNSGGGVFSVKAGFWAAPLAPTAATVFVGGRVSVEGSLKGIRGVTVTLTDANGATRSVITGAGGRFRFDGLEAGQTYVFTVSARRFAFASPTVVHFATENFDELNFSGTTQF